MGYPELLYHRLPRRRFRHSERPPESPAGGNETGAGRIDGRRNKSDETGGLQANVAFRYTPQLHVR